MYKIPISLFLLILLLACDSQEDPPTLDYKVDYNYVLKHQQIDSVTAYNYQGKINDQQIIDESLEKINQNKVAEAINFSDDDIFIRFTNDRRVRYDNDGKITNFTIEKENNLLRFKGDTIITLAFDENNFEYSENSLREHFIKYKSSIIWQQEKNTGYTYRLHTALYNSRYFYPSEAEIIEPLINIILFKKSRGYFYDFYQEELNNELSSNAYMILDSGDLLVVQHISRIYR